ncbi:murein biosynthesis integral membrane protein MurJ [Rhodopseudomonas sp. HC1]|uniref:murein biosynthesis integral membrane protein MurJ n=1 Tax=Rhodopseudomonas infernalis TaxID=2897386 RepID=UPI001EE8E212|nr:murein biosynthesis integral membrane protein MurJ [Rhodopseudomonas infernalis]MCG6207799.1 murein biosynthesis integral membrane protein MurJ [Rhodopseudomonas infernalis]
MIRPLLTVSAGTLSSRLLGFVRDALVAALLGAGAVADAFLLAFQLVNVTRRLLTEGALNAALVPAWLRVREHNGAAAAAAFAGRLLGTVALATLVLAVLVGVFMPLLIALLAPGFVGQPTLGMAVRDARLMLPYLAFAGPVAVMMGLFNAQGKVGLTAFSPLLFNAALIVVTAVLLFASDDDVAAAWLLSATVGIAGLLQLSILVFNSRGEKLATPLRVSFDTAMRAFFVKAIPGMIANSGPQLLIVIGAIVASSTPSAVSWLYFANRLIELPLGIVGVAMGAVLVPELARAVRGDDRAAQSEAASRGLELALGVALPATLGLIVLREPIVRLLFEHGAFGAEDTAATALALGILALGLPAQVLAKTWSAAFYAREDTRTPLIATLLALAVALVAALLLGRLLGAAGVALAIVLGGSSNAAVLLAQGLRRFGVSIDAAARRRLVLIAVAAAAMGGLLTLKASFVLPWAAPAGALAQAAALGVLIAGGLIVYGGLLVLFGVVRPAALGTALRSPRGLRG